MHINESNLQFNATITKMTLYQVTITVLNQKIDYIYVYIMDLKTIIYGR